MMKIKYKSILCVLMTLFFLAGIFGSINSVESVSHELYHTEKQAAVDLTKDKETKQIPDRLLPTETVDGVDDFHARSVRRKESQEIEETARIFAVAFFVVAILQIFNITFLENRFCFRETRIHIFEVIRFIHQMDGKKKSYFA